MTSLRAPKSLIPYRMTNHMLKKVVYKANLKWLLKRIQYIVKNRQTRIKTANNVIPFA